VRPERHHCRQADCPAALAGRAGLARPTRPPRCLTDRLTALVALAYRVPLDCPYQHCLRALEAQATQAGLEHRASHCRPGQVTRRAQPRRSRRRREDPGDPAALGDREPLVSGYPRCCCQVPLPALAAESRRHCHLVEAPAVAAAAEAAVMSARASQVLATELVAGSAAAAAAAAVPAPGAAEGSAAAAAGLAAAAEAPRAAAEAAAATWAPAAATGIAAPSAMHRAAAHRTPCAAGSHRSSHSSC